MHPAGINTPPTIERHLRRLQRLDASIVTAVSPKREKLEAEADQIRAMLAALANDIKAVL